MRLMPSTRRGKVIGLLAAVILMEGISLAVWHFSQGGGEDDQLRILREHLDEASDPGAVVRIRDESLTNKLTCTVPPFVKPEEMLRHEGIEPTIKGADYGDDIAYFIRVNDGQKLVRGFVTAAMPFEEAACVEGRFYFRITDCKSRGMDLSTAKCASIVKE
jgi:hypothetical protein